jgi:hypothetical protein
MTRRRTLSIAIPGNAPPNEFRLFVAGPNPTTKGVFLFDDEAATWVMSAYEQHGVDVMIDVEHQSLDPESAAYDPDPRGWCKLAVRNGELWAVDVTWAPDGIARLTQKRQRYVSPAFTVDPENRITELLNIALVAMPATHDTPALIAASRLGGHMDSTLVSEALDALIAGDAEKCAELLKSIIAAAASGDSADPDATTEDAPPPAGDGGADEDTEPPPAKTKASARLAAYEREERIRLCRELVVAGGRAPAVVWADADARSPRPYLKKMSLTELREHVAIEVAAAGRGKRIVPPSGDGAPQTFSTPSGNVTLAAEELAICKELKCDPSQFAQLKVMRGKGG